MQNHIKIFSLIPSRTEKFYLESGLSSKYSEYCSQGPNQWAFCSEPNEEAIEGAYGVVKAVSYGFLCLHRASCCASVWMRSLLSVVHSFSTKKNTRIIVFDRIVTSKSALRLVRAVVWGKFSKLLLLETNSRWCETKHIREIRLYLVHGMFPSPIKLIGEDILC